MSIEVEHKFTVTPLTRQQLEAMGAKRKTSCTFTDTYLDVKHNTLMLSDCWLRKRDGAWELKHPLVDSAAVGQSSKDVGHVSDRYNELQNEVEILAFLRTVIATEIDVCTDSGPTSLDQLVQEGILISVAEFETTRETYVCKSGDHCETFDSVVHVDLDETKFGYVVGEVEVMVGRGELIPAAEAKALDIAKQIGECGDVPPGGKLSCYLLQHNPLLWQQLIKRNVIRSLAANLYSTKSILFPLLIAIFSVWKQKLLLLISYTTMITYVTGSAILAQNFGVT